MQLGVEYSRHTGIGTRTSAGIRTAISAIGLAQKRCVWVGWLDIGPQLFARQTNVTACEYPQPAKGSYTLFLAPLMLKPLLVNLLSAF